MISFMLDFFGDLIVGLFPALKRRRDRSKEWSGTVEAKRTWTLSRHAYLVIFRTDDGLRKKVRMDRKEDFDFYEEGLSYAKKAGDDLPNPAPAGGSSKTVG